MWVDNLNEYQHLLKDKRFKSILVNNYIKPYEFDLIDKRSIITITVDPTPDNLPAIKDLLNRVDDFNSLPKLLKLNQLSGKGVLETSASILEHLISNQISTIDSLSLPIKTIINFLFNSASSDILNFINTSLDVVIVDMDVTEKEAAIANKALATLYDTNKLSNKNIIIINTSKGRLVKFKKTNNSKVEMINNTISNKSNILTTSDIPIPIKHDKVYFNMMGFSEEDTNPKVLFTEAIDYVSSTDKETVINTGGIKVPIPVPSNRLIIYDYKKELDNSLELLLYRMSIDTM